MLYATENSKKKARFGLYKCYCENEFKVRTADIKNGHIKSCGCSRKGKNQTHGLRSHRLYIVWHHMLDRCNNIESDNYKYYGERGIEICESWFDIRNFIDDMFPTFIEGLTLDRINVNGNYEPSNCRWVNQTVQSRNTRRLRSTNTSGYRGVGFHKKDNRFRSRITVDLKNIHIGNFKTALEAAKAYDKYIIDNNLEHTKNF